MTEKTEVSTGGRLINNVSNITINITIKGDDKSAISRLFEQIRGLANDKRTDKETNITTPIHAIDLQRMHDETR